MPPLSFLLLLPLSLASLASLSVLSSHQMFALSIRPLIDVSLAHVPPDPQAMVTAFWLDKSQEVKHLYETHEATRDAGTRLEFLSKEWLQKWLKEDKACKWIESRVVNNSRLLCRHGKLCLTKVTDVKCTSAEAAAKALSRYERRPVLLTEDLCRSCVREKVVAVQRAHQVSEDVKAIQETLKIGSVNGVQYVVGNESFRNWKTLAFEEFDRRDRLEEEKRDSRDKKRQESSSSSSSSKKSKRVAKVVAIESEDIKPLPPDVKARLEEAHELIDRTPSTDDGESSQSSQETSPPASSTAAAAATASSQESSASEFRFNEDVICQHGNLTTDKTLYRLVPRHVWRILSKYFTEAREFQQSVPVCQECKVRPVISPSFLRCLSLSRDVVCLPAHACTLSLSLDGPCFPY